jgi:L-amino acid N-acyltransferase YncA
MTACTIRAATNDDALAIASIYGHFVRSSTATFELDPPDALEIARRIDAVHQLGLPYLVAEHDNRILGYAYATQFRPRPAYRFTVEDSVYVDADSAGHGIGRQLLARLIEASRTTGARQMIASIGGENPASIALHTSQGFESVGTLRAVGFKFDQWINVTLMQRPL